MLEPIGYIGYYSRLPVLDIAGLVSPQVLSSYRQRVPYPLGDIVSRFRPTLLVLRADERASIEDYGRAIGRPVLDTDYRLVRTFAGSGGSTAFWVYRRAGTRPPVGASGEQRP